MDRGKRQEGFATGETPVPPLSWLGQLKINREEGLGFDCPSIEQVGFEAPLLDGFISSLTQDEVSADQLQILHPAIFSDTGLENDRSFHAGSQGLVRITGLNFFEQ